MSVTQPIEWQCGTCGMWLDGGWGRHVHVKVEPLGLDDMVLARRCAEMSVPGVDPMSEKITAMTTYWRTGKEPTREKKL